MSNNSIQKCFVVMPFGKKPKSDGSGGYYDFDKIYRVIIRRAIREANMEPIRADETGGNRLIHSDMFKDLRDRPIVIADLSMFNPNVFYELGIRHVMSPTGTVLMCSTDFTLPFDVALSRTVFYDYDGEHLDWEEAERVVNELTASLEEAKRGTPDSPVYAFLEHVLSPHAHKNTGEHENGEHEIFDEDFHLHKYQEMIADLWQSNGEEDFDKLSNEHRTSVFGTRTLGYYALKAKLPVAVIGSVAEMLYYSEQYDLTNRLYDAIDQQDTLTIPMLMRYGSSISEEQSSLASATRGLEYLQKARVIALKQFEEDPEIPARVNDVAHTTHSHAGMMSWIWTLSQKQDDLKQLIEELVKACEYAEKAIEVGGDFPVGRYAQTMMRLTIFLRIMENDRERHDAEGYLQKILSLRPPAGANFQAASYLRWYQVIALSDIGDAEGAQKRAMFALSEDIKIMYREESKDVGKRQYTALRRFLEQYSNYWRNPSVVAKTSQLLQSVDFR